MNILRNLTFFVFGLSCMSNCFALSDDWSDVVQDSIQMKEPVQSIYNYNKYILINPKLKIKLKDYGDITKTKNNITFTQKKIGVQVLNNNKIYNIFNDIVPVRSNVNMHLLYNDSLITGVSVKENYEVNYIEDPYKRSEVIALIYNVKENKVVTIHVMDSSSEVNGIGLDLFQGDQLTIDSKTKKISYYAEIKEKNKKISKFKVVLDSSFKCVSATLGCENVGVSYGELVGVNK